MNLLALEEGDGDQKSLRSFPFVSESIKHSRRVVSISGACFQRHISPLQKESSGKTRSVCGNQQLYGTAAEKKFSKKREKDTRRSFPSPGVGFWWQSLVSGNWRCLSCERSRILLSVQKWLEAETSSSHECWWSSYDFILRCALLRQQLEMNFIG